MSCLSEGGPGSSYQGGSGVWDPGTNRGLRSSYKEFRVRDLGAQEFQKIQFLSGIFKSNYLDERYGVKTALFKIAKGYVYSKSWKNDPLLS